MVLLHGLGDAAGVVGGLGHSLSGRGYCILAPDLRGHGDSSRSSQATYTCEALVEDLLAFVVALVRSSLSWRHRLTG